jgi:hypothetical protein
MALVTGVKLEFVSPRKETAALVHSAEAVLTDIYDAWRAHDLDLLATYLPDDFSHSINIPAEMHPLGGLRCGNPAALERLGQIFQQFDTRRLEPNRITLDTNGAAIEVLTRCRHRESGAWLDTIKSNIWALEDGWPVGLEEIYDLDRFRTFMDSVAAL